MSMRLMQNARMLMARRSGEAGSSGSAGGGGRAAGDISARIARPGREWWKLGTVNIAGAKVGRLYMVRIINRGKRRQKRRTRVLWARAIWITTTGLGWVTSTTVVVVRGRAARIVLFGRAFRPRGLRIEWRV